MPLFRPKERCPHCGWKVRQPSDPANFLCPTCDKPGPFASEDQVLAWEKQEAKHVAEEEARQAARAKYEELLTNIAGGVKSLRDGSELANVRAAAGYESDELDEINMKAFRSAASAAVADDLLTPDESSHLQALQSALELTGEEIMAADPALWERVFVSSINGGELPEVSSPHILARKGEVVHFECDASLMKEVAVRQYQGGYQGFSIPLGKSGVRYRVGGSKGYSVQVGTELQVADTGILSVTNRRAVYAGTRKTIEMLYAKLVNLTVYSDGVQFHLSNRVNAPLFVIPRGSDIVAAIVNKAAQHVDE